MQNLFFLLVNNLKSITYSLLYDPIHINEWDLLSLASVQPLFSFFLKISWTQPPLSLLSKPCAHARCCHSGNPLEEIASSLCSGQQWGRIEKGGKKEGQTGWHVCNREPGRWSCITGPKRTEKFWDGAVLKTARRGRDSSLGSKDFIRIKQATERLEIWDERRQKRSRRMMTFANECFLNRTFFIYHLLSNALAGLWTAVWTRAHYLNK